MSKILSFAHTLLTEEASKLGLPEFPIENLPSAIAALNSAPNLSPTMTVDRLYPYKLFLPTEGCQSVEQTLETFNLSNKSPQGATSIESISKSGQSDVADVGIRVGRKLHKLKAFAGSGKLQDLSASNETNYVPTAYHEGFLVSLRKIYPPFLFILTDLVQLFLPPKERYTASSYPDLVTLTVQGCPILSKYSSLVDEQ